ncbi:hypothetical protein XO10_07030 [Marinitoga sp. 1135]|uniref:HD domain-containing phosphohydrolase n=1 Tax=Marinitoga sp. 1135 TaxID=1643333 RepID=UPI001586B519|nr:HD domain-containing phosphohydrolase [Marinitoga sp. 1135]NUU96027.1 hypothetical protein [Marinitoga sp. 1135]
MANLKILVADDEDSVRYSLKRLLKKWGYEIYEAQDGQEVINMILPSEPVQLMEKKIHVNFIILDLKMPGIDGFEVLEKISNTFIERKPYIIVLSGIEDKDSIVKALELGADDYMTKPFEIHELKARLKAAERHHALEIKDSFILMLSKMTEFKSFETGKHIERVQKFAVLLAKEYFHLIGKEPDISFLYELHHAAPLHDIGKLLIPEQILSKPGPLSANEFEIMKMHTVYGARMLSEISEETMSFEYFKTIHEVVLHHHERWDGKGYPEGLKEEQIPLSARIVSLCDTYDAITSKRVYKDAQSHEFAVSEILEGKGTQFDPEIVEAFENIQHLFKQLREKFTD